MAEKTHTIISFNVMGKNDTKLFKAPFRYLVDERNEADIVLLQEVKIEEKSELLDKINEILISDNNNKNKWTVYKNLNHISGATANQYNVVLIKEDGFIKIKDMYNDWHNKYKILDKNVQAFILKTEDEKEFVVVNACGFDQDKKYFDDLKQFIKEVGFYRPLILGGDLEISLQKLLKEKANDNSFYDWYIDGTIEEFNKIDDKRKNGPHWVWAWTTDVKRKIDCDHFVFNEKFNVYIKPRCVEYFHEEYSMSHGFINNYEDGIIYQPGGDYEDFSNYISNVSSHIPICLTFKI